MYGVTGGSGVLGRLVVAELEARGLKHCEFAGDVRDRTSLRNWLQAELPERVIHLAARVAVDEVERDPLDAFSVNVEGTQNLMFEVARLARPPWVFLASTSHVYGGLPRPLRESDPLAPQNTYAETKLIAEMAAGFVARKSNGRLCVGRIFSFFHYTQRPPFLRPAMLERLQHHDPREPFVVRNGLDVRDMSDAGDIAKLIVRLSTAGATGTLNIGSGIGTAVVAFVQGLAGDRITVTADQVRPPSHLVADITSLRAALND